ncbi:hypothetical protein [Rhodoligotrophos defluvii]|uniref:hypothetical protein n=1 Tax=Rhodoligotrophos defluvii TaxID=2561934 RepID=UPI0010C97188|nr:hypothetical protein [Rhodoligotrophos defluvii]
MTSDLRHVLSKARCRAACMVLVVLLAVPAQAENTRYTIEETSDGGFVRVDQQTGGMLKCAGERDAISCVPINDDSQKLREENAELRAENSALKQRVAELEQAAKAPEATVKGSTEKQLDQIAGFFEDMVRRLFRFAQSLQEKPGEEI